MTGVFFFPGVFTLVRESIYHLKEKRINILKENFLLLFRFMATLRSERKLAYGLHNTLVSIFLFQNKFAQ